MESGIPLATEDKYFRPDMEVDQGPTSTRSSIAINNYWTQSSLVQLFIDIQATRLVPPQLDFTSRIVSVPKASVGLRLGIDLSPLNRYCLVSHFKWQTTKIAEPSCHAALGNVRHTGCLLTHPYLPHISSFLAFRFIKQLYFVRTMPVGLKSAPYVVMRLLQFPLAMEGIRTLAYLDDWTIYASTPQQAWINLARLGID